MTKSLIRARSAAFRRQAGRCFYCSVLMWANDCVSFAKAHGLPRRLATWLQCTAEHLKPRQEGGSDSQENIAAACRLCNQRRHARMTPPTPEKYRQLVKRRMASAGWHDSIVHRRRIAH